MKKASIIRHVQLCDALVMYLDNGISPEETARRCVESYLGKGYGWFDLFGFVPERVNAIIALELQSKGLLCDIYSNGYKLKSPMAEFQQKLDETLLAMVRPAPSTTLELEGRITA